MNATNFDMIAGDTVPLTVTVKKDGVIRDISGYVFYFIAKNKLDDAQNAIYKKVTSLTDPTHGITEIVLSESDTNIPCKKYVYKIYCVSPIGVKTTLFYGELTLIKT